MNPRPGVFLLSGAAVLLAAAGLIVPFGDGELLARSQAAARDGLQRIIAAERTRWQQQGRLASFGPADAELRATLGSDIDLGPAAELFTFDALPNGPGRLQVRAVSRAEAVRSGRVAPLLETLDLEEKNDTAPTTEP